MPLDESTVLLLILHTTESSTLKALTVYQDSSMSPDIIQKQTPIPLLKLNIHYLFFLHKDAKKKKKLMQHFPRWFILMCQCLGLSPTITMGHEAPLKNIERT
jgi:hypothetical protein